MSNPTSLTFGPIPSRRFGISLGIDLSPNTKQCNFDCLYCELEPAKTVAKMSEYPKVKDIIDAVKKAFLVHNNIDVLTVTANGEPTLYPFLDELIDALDVIKKDRRILILSNGANIYDSNIQKILTKIDIVKLSLDCVSKKCFKKLDRNDKSVEVEKIVEGMVTFRALHNKAFILEVLFVQDLNDSEEEIRLLHEAIKKINPNRVDIGTVDRPPAYKIKPISYEKLSSIADIFNGINVNIVHANKLKAIQNFTQNEILTLLKRRPLTTEDIQNMFTQESLNHLENLLLSNRVNIVDCSGVKFYKVL